MLAWAAPPPTIDIGNMGDIVCSKVTTNVIDLQEDVGHSNFKISGNHGSIGQILHVGDANGKLEWRDAPPTINVGNMGDITCDTIHATSIGSSNNIVPSIHATT